MSGLENSYVILVVNILLVLLDSLISKFVTLI